MIDAADGPRARGGSTGPRGLTVDVPGAGRISVCHLVLDYNGTLAVGGVLRPGVGRRLRRLAETLDVSVVTADTFGTVAASMRRLPVRVTTIRNGADKERYVRSRAGDGVVAVGNGANDLRMMRAARLAIAVLEGDGLDPRLLRHAAVLVRRIEEGLDLLLDPRRLVATLRT
jgi:soluble P-type ATPase